LEPVNASGKRPTAEAGTAVAGEAVSPGPAVVPILLSGGSGTRLWPLSRERYPKQFLPLTGERTMFQETLARLDGLTGLGAPVVVCNEEHRFLVAEQLRALGRAEASIILEPAGRNTAPAIAMAALEAEARFGDSPLLVLPADHAISDVPALHRAVAAGTSAAEAGRLVTFGVVPTTPETGYGYIQAGEGVDAHGSRPVHRFLEKPSPSVAEELVNSGDYFWNSGMFLFRPSRLLAELEIHAPAILAACRDAFTGGRRDLDFLRLEGTAFTNSPAISLDYAVMENTDAAAVIPLEAGWSDVGSWCALQSVTPSDGEGNVAVGDVVARDTRNSYLHAESRLVTTVGLDNHLVVETPDAVLVAHRDRAQEVKEVVAQLRDQGRTEALQHRRVYRPWGTYEPVAEAERFQVKRILVQPGEGLSLQLHHHRAEHWVVVRGTARVSRGQDTFLLTEDQSTYIPIGHKHRIENPGVIPLELIEVQTGSYLGEDDILRFGDRYGRN